MELITILNRCHRLRGFIYERAHFSADKKSIEVAVRPRKGSSAVCSRCNSVTVTYDPTKLRTATGLAYDTLTIGVTSDAGQTPDFVQSYTITVKRSDD